MSQLPEERTTCAGMVEGADRELSELLAEYKELGAAGDQAVLVELLREIQRIYGCVPVDVQEETAKALGIKQTVIGKLVKLYPSFTAAPARSQVCVCLGERCGAKGAGAVAEAVRQAVKGLGKPVRVTVRNCAKQCATAPNMWVDGKRYPSVTPGQVEEILQKRLVARGYED